MVRRLWQNRLVQAFARLFRLFSRWVLIWLSFLVRTIGRSMRASRHFLRILLRPRDPNNVFVARTEGSHHAVEGAVEVAVPDDSDGTKRHTLLYASQQNQQDPQAEGALPTDAVSLWRGDKRVTPEDAAPGATAANRRYAYLDVLAAQLKHLNHGEITQLEELVHRLARKWLDVDEQFEELPRRNKLDVDQTLRYNIPRYAGRILNFKWAVKERPIPQLSKPARILVIGDVSHSMVHYVSVVLYFFHMLNFRFVVDSYIFSEKATHAAPFLNGLGTFEEKVHRLVAGAKSWDAGTRLGSALEEVAKTAYVDENTYVIIATDGKVSTQEKETAKIEQHMQALRRKAKQLLFLTPSVEFSDGGTGKTKIVPSGSFKYNFYDIPIFQMGPPLWYGVLSHYADRLYLIRTVQDLIDMTEDLILGSRGA